MGRLALLLVAWAATAWSSIHVDACAPGSGDGSSETPYDELGLAVALSPSGSSLQLGTGSYPQPLIIAKPLTLSAPNGHALIGGAYVGSLEICVPIRTSLAQPKSLPEGSCCQQDPDCDLENMVVNARIHYPAAADGVNAACGGPFPIVVFSHAKRHQAQNPVLCDWSDPGGVEEDYKQFDGILSRLAGSGIITASVDQSFSPHWVSRGAAALNTLASLRDQGQAQNSPLFGSVDLSRTGFLGHSTGGAATTFAVREYDSPAHANLDLGSVQVGAVGMIAPACETQVIEPPCFSGVPPPSAPLMVIHSGNEPPCQVGELPLYLYAEANAPKHLVVVEGANHFGYTDAICLEGECEPVTLPRDSDSRVGGASGPEAHARQQRTAREYIHAFLSHYLLDDGPALDFLLQQSGEQCGNPGTPPACAAPARRFDALNALNIETSVCSCLP